MDDYGQPVVEFELGIGNRNLVDQIVERGGFGALGILREGRSCDQSGCGKRDRKRGQAGLGGTKHVCVP